VRVHYKNTFEVGRAVRGMTISKAKKYLKDVLGHKRCIPFVHHNKHVGRTAQAKEFNAPQGKSYNNSIIFKIYKKINLK
jgi:large subunit ribosomal protein L17e